MKSNRVESKSEFDAVWSKLDLNPPVGTIYFIFDDKGKFHDATRYKFELFKEENVGKKRPFLARY